MAKPMRPVELANVALARTTCKFVVHLADGLHAQHAGRQFLEAKPNELMTEAMVARVHERGKRLAAEGDKATFQAFVGIQNAIPHARSLVDFHVLGAHFPTIAKDKTHGERLLHRIVMREAAETLAAQGEGSYQAVRELDDARVKLVRSYARTLHANAKGINEAQADAHVQRYAADQAEAMKAFERAQLQWQDHYGPIPVEDKDELANALAPTAKSEPHLFLLTGARALDRHLAREFPDMPRKTRDALKHLHEPLMRAEAALANARTERGTRKILNTREELLRQYAETAMAHVGNASHVAQLLAAHHDTVEGLELSVAEAWDNRKH